MAPTDQPAAYGLARPVQLGQDGCLIMLRERVALLACILRLGGVIDRDRFGARGGELERIGCP